MDLAQKAYDHLAAQQLKAPGVTLGRALRREVLQINGKIFAFLKDGRLVVKVPADRAATLLREGTAQPFESGGRAMKEWIAVALPDGGDKTLWSGLMDAARQYVGHPA